MSDPTTLVLFDIDGTLVQTLGAGIRGMNAAFAQLYGASEALEGVPVAGRTDRAIVWDAFRHIGITPDEARIAELRDAYVARLPSELIKGGGASFGVLPGVWALLDQLAARPDTVVGLLTGNFVRGAEAKLGHFALWNRFPFGAFGDRHLDRRDLVPVALDEARQRGFDVEAGWTFVVGDTPLDIDCAHANGAVAIAVATGLYGAADLAAFRPGRTVETLEALLTDQDVWRL